MLLNSVIGQQDSCQPPGAVEPLVLEASLVEARVAARWLARLHLGTQAQALHTAHWSVHMHMAHTSQWCAPGTDDPSGLLAQSPLPACALESRQLCFACCAVHTRAVLCTPALRQWNCSALCNLSTATAGPASEGGTRAADTSARRRGRHLLAWWGITELSRP
jgi:hypothetical protein